MSKASHVALTAAAWICWFLDFAGWAILLGGLSGMQQVCRSTAGDHTMGSVRFCFSMPTSCRTTSLPNHPLSYCYTYFASTCCLQACGGTRVTSILSGGSAGYNGAISCDVFFSYTWWIWAYGLFIVVLTPAIMGSGALARFRPGLITLLTIAAMQAMQVANTYLYFNQLPETSSGGFAARYQTTVAGGIIKAIALLLLIAILGVRDEETTLYETSKQEKRSKRGAEPPSGPPVSTNPLEPEEDDRRVTATPATTASPV